MGVDEKYRLETTGFGYCLYDKEEHPVIVHSAAPIINSREEERGNMKEQPIPDIVKTALYALDVMQTNFDRDDKIRSRCYEKVFETELEEEMTHIEKQLVNLIWNQIQNGDPAPEIEKFFDWCIETCDAEEVVEIQMMADALNAEVEANLKEKSPGEGGDSE